MTVVMRSSKAQNWFDLMQAQHMKAQAESVSMHRARLRAGSATVALNMTAGALQSLTGLSVDPLDPTDAACIRFSPQDRVVTGRGTSWPLVFIDAPFFHRRVPLPQLPSGLLDRMTESALGETPAAPDMSAPVDFSNQGEGRVMCLLALQAFIDSGRCVPEDLSQWRSLPSCSYLLADEDSDVWRISAMGNETHATGEALWDLYEQSLEELKTQP